MDALSIIVSAVAALLVAVSVRWKICLCREIKKREDLERKLAHHMKRIALMDATDLPKCKSVACYNCKHCAWLYNPGSTAIYLLGCGKGLKCKDFEFTGLNKPPAWERKSEMIRMEEMSESSEESALDAQMRPPFQPIDSAPKPPCHCE